MFDFLDFSAFGPQLVALGQVIVMDLVLAGDNAIVIGLAAAGLPAEQRRRAILIGILAATVMRIGFALIAQFLLTVIGLTFAGGLLLLWVCWKFWRELESERRARLAAKRKRLNAEERQELAQPEEALPGAPVAKTMRQAVTQIVIADLSMSLDNVLAVAGAARDHPGILAFGLVLSIALMGLAAGFIADLLKKHHWIAYIGLLIILYVSIDMIWHGWSELSPYMP